MKTTDLLLTIFGAFLWGVSPVIHKYLLGTYNQLTIMILISFIYTICLLLCLPFYSNAVYKDIFKLNVHDIILFLISGVFTLFLGNAIYYYVLKDNHSHVISALDSSAPFFTLILAYLLLKEKINIFGVLGTILIVLGVICISYNDTDMNISEMFMVRR
jgi:drug/metabolite transporter (DMT)-like permease